MKTCGILITKKNSKRFPGKNRFMFERNVEIMIAVVGSRHTYMLTDDDYIFKKCIDMGINVIKKGPNIDDEMPSIEVIKYALMNIHIKYDIVCNILCNSIGHDEMGIIRAIEKLKSDESIIEVKSFDSNGDQSGIFAWWADKLPLHRHKISSINSNGKEIHYKSELK